MKKYTRPLAALALIVAMGIALFTLLPRGIPSKSQVARWDSETATKRLAGTPAADLEDAWGSFDGMWWYAGGKQIIVYYENSPQDPEPVIREVTVQPRNS